MEKAECWIEREDWIEFYSGREISPEGNGVYSALINFSGPGKAVPYHFFARVYSGLTGKIENISIEGAEFRMAGKTVEAGGTPAGMKWVYLGETTTGRNYRMAKITAPGGLSNVERICVAQVPERIYSGEAERLIEAETRGGEPLSGVPLGGAGAGKIEFCRDGLFRNITINGNIDAPIRYSPLSFFAVRAEQGRSARIRIVSARGLHGLPPMRKMEFEGFYPGAEISAEDPGFPVKARIRAIGPVIPENIKDSSLPLSLFSVSLTSKTDEPVEASLAFTMENFLGAGGVPVKSEKGFYECWRERAGNTETRWKSGNGEGIIFRGAGKKPAGSEDSYVLATDSIIHSAAGGISPENAYETWKAFLDSGRLPGFTGGASSGEQTAGAAEVRIRLMPGETREIKFVFAWHLAHFMQSADMDYGHYYSNHFDNAAQTALYGLKFFDKLDNGAMAVPELLKKSSIPPWFAKTMANDAYVFSTCTWLTYAGRFAVNESPTNMFGCMGTIDQKLYGNHYFSLFFPELDRSELLSFARAQAANGGIQHDLGYGHIDRKNEWDSWPDLSSSLTILCLKHYQLTGDEEFIKEVYPRLVRALLDFQLGMDTDGDLIANISGVGNTFDSEEFQGTSSYIASLWLAALKALQRLAAGLGDAGTADTCKKIFKKAKENAIKELWNGSYFINYYDSSNRRGCSNSHLSQLAGEFFAKLCGLGPLYGDFCAAKAARSTLELNYGRRFAAPSNEATPEGKMPRRNMWGWLFHARVFLCGLPLFLGMHDEALEALERMDRVVTEYNGENRWDARLFFEPDTGRQHWGRFYMSAPSSWYVYQALAGYIIDRPSGLLRLIPNIPEHLMPFRGPVFAPGLWFWLEYEKKAGLMAIRVIRKSGNPPKFNRLQVPPLQGIPACRSMGVTLPLKRTGKRVPGGKEYACKIDFESIDEITIEWS